jgi:hypothetical protein
MEKRIWISTTRFSEVFRRLLQKYRQGVRVEIDGVRHSDADIDSLIASWCTNAKICVTRDFGLWQGEAQLFGFHDSPRQLWAACSELPFIETLQRENIIRYEILEHKRVGIWSCIMSFFRA